MREKIFLWFAVFFFAAFPFPALALQGVLSIILPIIDAIKVWIAILIFALT